MLICIHHDILKQEHSLTKTPRLPLSLKRKYKILTRSHSKPGHLIGNECRGRNACTLVSGNAPHFLDFLLGRLDVVVVAVVVVEELDLLVYGSVLHVLIISKTLKILSIIFLIDNPINNWL